MATYYFSSTQGSDSRTSFQAQSPTTPWQTLTKHNSTSFSAGDVILFNKGDVFFGELMPQSSGASGSPITYGSYGTGVEPVITGFATISSWSLLSGHVYFASLDVPMLNMVTLDGVVRAMGRYPNSGYLTYTGHVKDVVTVANVSSLPPQNIGSRDWVVYIVTSDGLKRTWNGSSYVVVAYPFGNGTQSIDGSSIGSLPFDPTGAEAVVRKDRYYVDRQQILERNGNILRLGRDNAWGANDQNATNNNGYFIQGHLGTLDTDGDWYYDKAAKRLYMYFSATPSGRVVQAASKQIGFVASSRLYLSMSNIKMNGYNVAGINMDYSSHLVVNSMKIERIGGNGIEGLQGTGSHSLTGCDIDYCLNGGISLYDVNDMVITDNVVTNTHTLMGMGKSGDAAGNGIHFFGNNQTVTGNRVTNSGFNGISFYAGNNVLVEKNKVDTHCVLKDDGGGIYAYGISAQTFSNRVIQNNTVINGIGSNNVAVDGLGSYVGDIEFGITFGVYLDNFSTQVIVNNNRLFNNTAGGVFVNLWGYDSITNNTIYNGKYGISIGNFGNIRSLIVTGNKIIAKTPDQLCMFIASYNGVGDIANFGTFNNNLYSRPASEGNTIRVTDGNSVVADYTVAQWKSAYSKDSSSTASIVTTDNVSKIRTDFNFTNAPVALSLGAIYKGVDNSLLNGTETIPAFGGTVKIYQSSGGGSSGGSGKILVSPSGKILTHGGKILVTP